MSLDPAIVVAGIAAAGVIGSAWISTHQNREMKRTLGTLNGGGTAMEMLEAIKTWIVLHETRHGLDDRRPKE